MRMNVGSKVLLMAFLGELGFGEGIYITIIWLAMKYETSNGIPRAYTNILSVWDMYNST